MTLTENIAELRPQEEYVGVLKTFTDNIVIGHPIYEDGESQLGSIFLNYAAYQLSLTLEGFFVRGRLAPVSIMLTRNLLLVPLFWKHTISKAMKLLLPELF